MDLSKEPKVDTAYIEKKRQELKIFFRDSKLSQNKIDKIIENELSVLKDHVVKEGDCKSEYEVMSGQPFTDVGENVKPLTNEEIKRLVKENPKIAEKASQIASKSDMSRISIPLDKLNIPSYSDMEKELAGGDSNKIREIRYRNLKALMNSVEEFKGTNYVNNIQTDTKQTGLEESNDDDDDEFESIDKIVTEITNKPYDLRFQETKEMLQSLADKYDDPLQNCDQKRPLDELCVIPDPILKEASSHLVKGKIQRGPLEEIKESYAINQAMNISLIDNPVKLNLDGKLKNDDNHSNIHRGDNSTGSKVKNFETRLKDTESSLCTINSILSKFVNNKGIKNTHEKDTITLNDSNVNSTNKEIIVKDDSLMPTEQTEKGLDDQMENTLQNALNDLYETENNDAEDNNEFEFKEMKNLARNIVEGAENLSTLIREDITNKLNSMNELLNDVNEALENSKKSNLVYQKLKEEGNAIKALKVCDHNSSAYETKENINNNELKISSVSQYEIDDINNAICKLNTEIQCHEDRVNTSQANYEITSKECQNFMEEIDGVLQKSQHILHPKTIHHKDTSVKEIIDDENDIHKQTGDDNVIRKERSDINSDDKSSLNSKMIEYNKREKERNKRINNLLHEIKDKMKDNKEVLRLANNLLRRDENNKSVEKVADIQEVNEEDVRVQGDQEKENEKHNHVEKSPEVSEIPSLQHGKGELNEEKSKVALKEKQREFQKIVDQEIEEMNRGPRMTKKFIKDHCKQHKLYSTPHLNDILYLHFKGFSKIENLEEYTGLKCIFLENNGIQRIEGLDTLSELKCLYLHYNVIRKIENLHGCPKLDTLNLDHNFVKTIENLEVVPDLHTLSIGHNMLNSVEDLENLKYCKNLSVLDLSYNRLEDPLIVDVLAAMQVLKVLVLCGNPVVRNIPSYRKTLTLRLKELLNLDNRPVFPRDRACAEAWQRGGIEEEVAERKRWIKKDQEKTMESVRYLIKMRDENKARREAREKAEREKLGLPPLTPKEEEPTENESTSVFEEKFGPNAVETKDGVAVDMLTGSEADDSTSEDSQSSDDEKKDENDETNKIEWSQVDRGRHLIQELKEEKQPQDLWSGFSAATDSRTTSDVEAVNNLLFKQPRVERKRVSQVLEDATRKSKDLTEKSSDEASTTHDAKRKPLIEIIEEINKRNQYEADNEDYGSTKDTKNTGSVEIPKEGNDVRDHYKNIIIKEESNNSELDNLAKNRPMKSITIKEIKADDAPTESDDNNCSERKEEKGNKSESPKEKTNSKTTTIEERRAEVQQNQGDGPALINYVKQMDSQDYDLDLEPSAEDLEIFKELDEEQLEREARIARGEPAVDPMKLYHKETMDEFYKEEQAVPAHARRRCSMPTHYRRDNFYDRTALSQLTAGDTPDPSKVKFTHLPDEVLVHYIDNQTSSTEVEYEIGEENIDLSPSSGDTESIINVSSSSSSESEVFESPKQTKVTHRPATAKIRRGKQDTNEERSNETEELQDDDKNYHIGDPMSSADRKQAKRSIINTINSTSDDRFPSEGINSDVAENARIEDSVATEILNKTLEVEQQQLYQQYDAVTSHASRVDNTTNCIIEEIANQLENEFTLPEVSRIVEEHVEEVEERNRVAEYYSYALLEESIDENDTTLVASHNTTLEDTLTESKRADDSGIHNESVDDKELTDTKAETDTSKVNTSMEDEIFEDCVDDNEVEEKFTLEMELALELDKNK